MDPRTQFARMFSPDASGWGNYGSPAMQSLAHDGAGEPSFQQAMVSMANASPTLARNVVQSTIQRSDVDQYGNPITPMQQGAATQPPLQGPPSPQGERQQGRQAPGGDAGVGLSTGMMVALGGAAFVGVMLLLRKKK